MPSPDAEESEIPRRRIIWFFALAALGCLADLLSKHFVFQHPEMYHGSEWWLWEGHLGIQKSLNEGALFGLGQGNVWLFATLSVAAVVAIPIWLFVFRAARDPLLTAALGCVSGGILGNLFDRVGLSGLKWDRFNSLRSGEDVYAVRDFILMQWNDRLVWPNYNIADALLVLGACFLLFQSWSTAKSDLVEGD
jgi:signal peptidase II